MSERNRGSAYVQRMQIGQKSPVKVQMITYSILETIFFLWFALSGWLFRILIFATWVLPIAGPLLIGAIANNLVIKGSCPACKRQFIGNKNQMVRCAGCGNIVWQPKGDFFTKGGNRPSSSSKSDPEIIDVEFEEK